MLLQHNIVVKSALKTQIALNGFLDIVYVNMLLIASHPIFVHFLQVLYCQKVQMLELFVVKMVVITHMIGTNFLFFQYKMVLLCLAV
ncbi:hypothetical protein C2G38_2078566 [Gigaspora rosea]|uniref:Uncharacterized protein n=1 Tax=Gigaspora rosea TaxID=44941 RepID=A0A397VHA1_9GLOM|nr:hypothetical protein C2G38_2078566 [Gigaspora rosea]